MLASFCVKQADLPVAPFLADTAGDILVLATGLAGVRSWVRYARVLRHVKGTILRVSRYKRDADLSNLE